MKFKQIISRIFFPERCEICGNIKPLTQPYCEKCGIDAEAISPHACPDCCHEQCMCGSSAHIMLPHFSAVYYYKGELKRSILSFKFNKDASYADIFGKAMADKIKELYPDISFDSICFVPMTSKAQKIRGYNQSELLAMSISQELSLPINDCLSKIKISHNQKELSAKERAENVKGSFELKENCNIYGQTLILCDDIKTTGATLRECCDTLIKGGAKDVYCICLALTPYHLNTDLF